MFFFVAGRGVEGVAGGGDNINSRYHVLVSCRWDIEGEQNCFSRIPCVIACPEGVPKEREGGLDDSGPPRVCNC